MRILLDECLPRRLKQHLIGHEVQTVPEAGWSGKRNGELLQLAEGRFDVLLTIDQKFLAQPRPGGVVVLPLQARTNRLDDIIPLLPDLLRKLAGMKSGAR